MHCWWVAADLYQKQIFTRVIASTQACWKPALQSSTQQWGLHFALNIVAVHCWWVSADLYQKQIFICVIEMIQVLQACLAEQH